MAEGSRNEQTQRMTRALGKRGRHMGTHEHSVGSLQQLIKERTTMLQMAQLTCSLRISWTSMRLLPNKSLSTPTARMISWTSIKSPPNQSLSIATARTCHGHPHSFRQATLFTEKTLIISWTSINLLQTNVSPLNQP